MSDTAKRCADAMGVSYDSASSVVMPGLDKCHGIAETIRGYKYSWSSEDELQRAIQSILIEKYGEFVEREVYLDSKSRIDFIADDIGIEIKIAGSQPEVLRQIKRYLEHDRIDGLVLVTTKSTHKAIALALLPKPIEVVHLSCF